MKRFSSILIAAIVLMVSTSTTVLADSDISVEQQPRRDALGMTSSTCGRVLETRSVKLDASSSARTMGSLIGAVAGGLLANNAAGSSSGGTRAAATALGAAIGGFGGNAVAGAVGADTGLEYAVRLDNGRLIHTVAADGNPVEGDRVKLVQGRTNGAWRIAKTSISEEDCASAQPAQGAHSTGGRNYQRYLQGMNGMAGSQQDYQQAEADRRARYEAYMRSMPQQGRRSY